MPDELLAELSSVQDFQCIFQRGLGIYPDLVTLDLSMPEDTGTQFYRNMSKLADFKDTPVIVISGLPPVTMTPGSS